MKLFIIATALLMATASATASQKIRTFSSTVNGASAHSPHIVHFNSQTGELAVCANGEASLCRRFEVPAKDVLPFSPKGQDRLLVVESTESLKSCSIGLGKLDCEPITIAQLSGGPQSLTGFTLVKLNATMNCAWSMAAGLNCSAVEMLPSSGGALQFGRFTGGGLQALSLEQDKICDIGGKCRNVQGLALLDTAKNVGSISRRTNILKRASLFGTGNGMHTACAAFFESRATVGFACTQEVVSAPIEVKAYTLAGTQVLFYPVRKNTKDSGSLLSNPATRKWSRDQAIKSKELVRSALRVAGTVGTRQNMLWQEGTIDDDIDCCDWQYKKTYYEYDDENDDEFWDVSNIYLEYNGDWFGDWYSDTFGLYYPVVLSAQAYQDCMNRCNMFKGIDDAMWNMLTAGTALAGTVGSVVAAIVSGPAGGFTLVGGMTVTTTVTATVAAIGMYSSNRRVLECYIGCQ